MHRADDVVESPEVSDDEEKEPSAERDAGSDDGDADYDPAVAGSEEEEDEEDIEEDDEPVGSDPLDSPWNSDDSFSRARKRNGAFIPLFCGQRS